MEAATEFKDEIAVVGLCPDLVEYAEAAYQLAVEVEELKSHIAAIMDGLDQELFN